MSRLEISGEEQSAKTLGAVTALKQEPLSVLGLGNLLLEAEHFPRGHQRRQLGQLRQHRYQLFAIRVAGCCMRTCDCHEDGVQAARAGPAPH